MLADNDCNLTPQGLKIPPPPWLVADVAAGGLLAIAGIGLGFLTLVLLIGENRSDSALVINVSFAFVAASLLLSSWLFGPAKHGVSIVSLGLRIPTPPGASVWLLPILVWVAVLTFNGLYGVVVTEMGWDSLEPPDLPFDTYGAGSLVITGLLVIVLGPFAEEVFFRGFVMAGLARRWGPVVGIVASSLLFSLAHGSVALIVPIFVAGSLLGWLYLRTGSLWGSIMVHMAQNAVAFTATIVI